MSLMAVHGRGGDIVMSMSAAHLIQEKTSEAPVLAVSEAYRPIAELMMEMGMPISGVITSTSLCPVLDRNVFGSSVSRWSSTLLKHVYGHDDNYNCCLGSVPRGIHLCSFMRYLTGLDSSLSSTLMPSPSSEYMHLGGDPVVVYHLGGSSKGKFIHLDDNPFPEMTSVFVGTKDDPPPAWEGIDMRGSDLVSLCGILRTARACVGSDSLVTHISSVMRVPTVSIHTVRESILMSDRKYSSRGHSLLYNEGEKVSVEVIDLMSRYMS